MFWLFRSILAAIGPGVFLVVASYAGCNRTAVVAMFTIGMGFSEFYYNYNFTISNCLTFYFHSGHILCRDKSQQFGYSTKLCRCYYGVCKMRSILIFMSKCHSHEIHHLDLFNNKSISNVCHYAGWLMEQEV